MTQRRMNEGKHNLTYSEVMRKSDVNIELRKKFYSGNSYHEGFSQSLYNCGEYYKNYEHDKTPVKDISPMAEADLHNEGERQTVSAKVTLTNSELEKLESKIYQNVSGERIDNDDSIVIALESKIELLKSTVQGIFDTFYASMKDFDKYKQRFEDILAKNREDAIDDMKDFINDMIHHITSSESILAKESIKCRSNTDNQEKGDSLSSHSSLSKEKQTVQLLKSIHSVVEAYTNDQYLTDSTFDDNHPSKVTDNAKTEEVINIYLLGGEPCVQIKMNDRNLLSEVNIKTPNPENDEFHATSADNLQTLSNRKIDIVDYVKEQKQQGAVTEKGIPVKVSFAKTDIHMDKKRSSDQGTEECKSFLFKICSYICKKLRHDSQK